MLPGAQLTRRVLIHRLCALDVPDAPSRHAAAETLKDDPEFLGTVGLAASAIVTARTVCGLDR